MAGKSSSKILKIKRGALFCLGLTFFTFPSQNWYFAVQLTYRLPEIQAMEVSVPPIVDYPINIGEMQPPSLTALSAVVIDRDSAVPLYQKKEKVPLLPASTVKIMTALLALDYYRFDDILTVGKVNRQGQDMKLMSGEKISVEDLLYGVLVASANDAALVLAQNYPAGEKGFVAAMNQTAERLNLKNTYFTNPTGLDSDEFGNLLPVRSYTTALDLAQLATWALKSETLARMVATEKITVSDVSGNIHHRLSNINQLLGDLEGIKGVKTGWTEEAGECLVSYVVRNGRGVITVILGSENRFGETTKLVNWAFANHTWEPVAPVL